MTCAHVGSTESDSDHERTMDAEYHLMQALGLEEVDLFAKADFISLDEGRDFLAEDKTYDVVILHHVYQHPGHGNTGIHGTSTLHTAEAWRERLEKASADWIFAYGGSTEVSGGYLDTIPGYEMLSYDHIKAVYEKK